jgi:hypothetical protein
MTRINLENDLSVLKGKEKSANIILEKVGDGPTLQIEMDNIKKKMQDAVDEYKLTKKYQHRLYQIIDISKNNQKQNEKWIRVANASMTS